MPTSFSRPLAAALAVAATAQAAGPAVTGLPPVPDAHGFAGAFAGIHRGHLLAGGGANFPDGVMPWDGGRKVWHDRVFALDLGNGDAVWRDAGKLPSRNGYGVSLTVDEGVLVIGGGDERSHFREVHLMGLDGDKVAFKPMPPLPVPLAQMAGALVGRTVHLCGGISSPDATTALAGHWTLDLDGGEKWLEAPALPAPGRILATAAAVDGVFIVAGGCSLAPDAQGKAARTYLRDAWKFSDGKWTKLADLPRASVAAANPAPVAGGAFFLVSGDDGTQTGLATPADHRGFTREILRYELPGDRWDIAGHLDAPAPVTLPAVPWKDGAILFNGEVKPGVRTPAVLLFTPSAPER